MLIAGNADNGGGGIANGFATPYQKMRAGLGLLTDGGGNKAVIISFSINGENPRGPGHGFVVAYDVRGLNRQAGFTPTPAIWNVTPGGGAGGIWMSGSGPAIDGEDIYFATGNGMDPGTMPGNFGESFVKLRYTRGRGGREQRQAELVVQTSGARSAISTRADRGSGSWRGRRRAHSRAGNLIGGGKDGILYNLDKNNLGKDTWDPQFNLPFVATYLPESAERRWQDCRRRRPPTRTGRSSTAIAIFLRRHRRARAITSTALRCTWARHDRHPVRVGRERAAQGLQLRVRDKAHHLVPRSGHAAGVGQHARARRHARWPPGRVVERHDAGLWGGLGRVPDARERQLRGRARRTRRLRRDDGHEGADAAAVSQRREAGERHGELCEVRDAGGGQREGLRRRPSATRSSSTASEERTP